MRLLLEYCRSACCHRINFDTVATVITPEDMQVRINIGDPETDRFRDVPISDFLAAGEPSRMIEVGQLVLLVIPVFDPVKEGETTIFPSSEEIVIPAACTSHSIPLYGRWPRIQRNRSGLQVSWDTRSAGSGQSYWGQQILRPCFTVPELHCEVGAGGEAVYVQAVNDKYLPNAGFFPLPDGCNFVVNGQVLDLQVEDQ